MSILRTFLLTAALLAVVAPAAVAGEQKSAPSERAAAEKPATSKRSGKARPTPGKPSGAKKTTPAERMVAKINKVRAKHDLQPLRKAPKLMRSSRNYARHLIRSETFAHGSSYAKTGFETTGETLAFRRGRSRKPWPTLRMWLASPPHRALILSQSFSHVGAAPASGRFDGTRATIWVTHLGAH
jgi:uncharacterized protein YkwD